MPGIKITGLRATPVNIPLEKPMWWTGGHYPGTSKIIIEVETDQGLIGLGEAPSIAETSLGYPDPSRNRRQSA